MIRKPARGASLKEIEELYRERLDQYRGVVAAILRDRNEAVDVVQEAFAVVVCKRAEFRGEGPVAAWVWQIVVRTALSHRRKRPAATASFADRVREVDSANGHGAFDGRVDVALALLPERQRVAVFLRYYADLDYGTIATVLGIAPGTVSATIHAAHHALRTRLEEVPL
jgi:RNA polymerase sigma-70 factor (ECF subfamily)